MFVSLQPAVIRAGSSWPRQVTPLLSGEVTHISVLEPEFEEVWCVSALALDRRKAVKCWYPLGMASLEEM
jgi:hypothetical protein